MSVMPSINTRQRLSRLVRRGGQYVSDKAVQIASDQTDSTNTPTSEIRAGNVIVYDPVEGKFVLTGDAGAQANAQASVTSTAAIATWNTKTLILTYCGGETITVTGTTADSCDQAVIDCNANLDFAAVFIADKVATNKLRIRTRKGGSDVYFTIGAGTENDVGGANATFTTGASYAGTDADYRILLDTVSVVNPADPTAAAVDGVGLAGVEGEFQAANLLGLTAEARIVLQRKGAIFYTGPGNT